ncbi:hypothetical protein GCM10010277_49670 [Streptomyces longisporoflavus]|nr:hypothetical protein GCM10010277_49670 [Streptomyces longisporoflavus]
MNASSAICSTDRFCSPPSVAEGAADEAAVSVVGREASSITSVSEYASEDVGMGTSPVGSRVEGHDASAAGTWSRVPRWLRSRNLRRRKYGSAEPGGKRLRVRAAM